MNKENQIEQGMGDIKVIIRDTIYSISNEEDRKYITEILRDAGYRKASDVAEEIFAEIENAHEECIHIDTSTNIGYLLHSKFEHKLAELKKKYTEDKGE